MVILITLLLLLSACGGVQVTVPVPGITIVPVDPTNAESYILLWGETPDDVWHVLKVIPALELPEDGRVQLELPPIEVVYVSGYAICCGGKKSDPSAVVKFINGVKQ